MRRTALLLALGACQPQRTSGGSRPAPPVHQYSVLDLVGTWQWLLRTEEAGTSRVEREEWHLRSDPSAPTHLVGRYIREVEVRSLDRVPFQCNQRPWYRQRSLYDVTADVDAHGAFHVHETGYATEPSPCDHGFRHVSDYQAVPHGTRLTLRWDDGAQTFFRFAPGQDLPVIYFVDPDGSEVVTNRHMMDPQTIVMERVAATWHLRLGNKVLGIYNSNVLARPLVTRTISPQIERVIRQKPEASPAAVSTAPASSQASVPAPSPAPVIPGYPTPAAASPAAPYFQQAKP